MTTSASTIDRCGPPDGIVTRSSTSRPVSSPPSTTRADVPPSPISCPRAGPGSTRRGASTRTPPVSCSSPITATSRTASPTRSTTSPSTTSRWWRGGSRTPRSRGFATASSSTTGPPARSTRGGWRGIAAPRWCGSCSGRGESARSAACAGWWGTRCATSTATRSVPSAWGTCPRARSVTSPRTRSRPCSRRSASSRQRRAASAPVTRPGSVSSAIRVRTPCQVTRSPGRTAARTPGRPRSSSAASTRGT